MLSGEKVSRRQSEILTHLMVFAVGKVRSLCRLLAKCIELPVYYTPTLPQRKSPIHTVPSLTHAPAAQCYLEILPTSRSVKQLGNCPPSAWPTQSCETAVWPYLPTLSPREQMGKHSSLSGSSHKGPGKQPGGPIYPPAALQK